MMQKQNLKEKQKQEHVMKKVEERETGEEKEEKEAKSTQNYCVSFSSFLWSQLLQLGKLSLFSTQGIRGEYMSLQSLSHSMVPMESDSSSTSLKKFQ
jgi:negative regulator of genetic competence, sporulation and motility